MKSKLKKTFALALLPAILIVMFAGLGTTANAALPIDANNGDWGAKRVTLKNTGEAELMVRVGDIDLTGYPEKIEAGFNPFTSENNISSWAGWDLDPTDPEGTDVYLVGSHYTGSPSGDGGAGMYRQWKAGTGYQGKAFAEGAAVITFDYDVSGVTVKNAEIQLYVNDFQSSLWGSDFSATLNGKAWPALSATLNGLLQTGAYLGWAIQPVPAEFLPDIASGKFVLTIDELNGAGDSYAVDFVKLLINKYNTDIPPKLSDGTNAPPATMASAASGNTVEFNGHRYQRIDEDMSWNDAKAYAEKLGGYLAVITSGAEWNAIKGLLSDAPMRGYWIGGKFDPAVADDFRWITGEAWAAPDWVNTSYSSRSGAEPALGIMISDMTWHDWWGIAGENCGFIIEFNYLTSQPAPNLSTASTWAQENINTAYAQGLIPSALQNKYSENATRAEFATLAVALYEVATGKEITERVKFGDTNDVNVEKAAAIGVVTGVGDNKFDPAGKLTREQAAVMLARLANAVGKPMPKQAATFADNTQVSTWATEAVGQVQAAEIMGGTGNNMFSPQGAYTKEQSIITILRLFNFVN